MKYFWYYAIQCTIFFKIFFFDLFSCVKLQRWINFAQKQSVTFL